jgi:hypothetical protein
VTGTDRGNWVRVPVGDGSEPYITVPFTRTVLVIARTLTTTVWLLDFLEEVFGDDPRVQVLFTVEDDAASVYHEEARTLLKEVGVAVLPWAQACATVFDLAICSTQNGSLQRLRSPLFITPHGPGFGKPASIRPGGVVPVPITDAWRNPSAPATTVVLSHPEQAALFAGAPAGVRFLVAGDPAYDRLSASQPRRHRYRHAFGLTGGQRMVLCSTTWGPGAQLGAIPDLAVRLAVELPVDEFQVALIIHPNIWFGHGPWQVRAWLRTAREGGVVLVPPRGDEWRAAVLASDILIADHGSVGFYAMAIGRPLLRASFGEQYLRADAPLAQLAERAPELSLKEPLRPQIEQAIDTHDPGLNRDLIDRMFAETGQSVRIMRDAIYELIGLEPHGPAPRVLAVTDPQIERPSVGSHIVTGDVNADAGSSATVTLRRLPAGLDRMHGTHVASAASSPRSSGGGGGGVRQPGGAENDLDTRRRESASIVTRSYSSCHDWIHDAWARRVLEELPGCRFAATLDDSAGEAQVTGRDGRRYHARWRPSAGIEAGPPAAAVLPSAVYLLDVLGAFDGALERPVTVRLGGLCAEASITLAREDPAPVDSQS